MPTAATTTMSLKEIPKLMVTPPPPPPSSPLLSLSSLPESDSQTDCVPSKNDFRQSHTRLTEYNGADTGALGNDSLTQTKPKRKRVRFKLDPEPFSDSKYSRKTKNEIRHDDADLDGVISRLLDGGKRRSIDARGADNARRVHGLFARKDNLPGRLSPHSRPRPDKTGPGFQASVHENLSRWSASGTNLGAADTSGTSHRQEENLSRFCGLEHSDSEQVPPCYEGFVVERESHSVSMAAGTQEKPGLLGRASAPKALELFRIANRAHDSRGGGSERNARPQTAHVNELQNKTRENGSPLHARQSGPQASGKGYFYRKDVYREVLTTSDLPRFSYSHWTYSISYGDGNSNHADTGASCNANNTAVNGTVRGGGVFTPDCCLRNNSFCSRSKQENCNHAETNASCNANNTAENGTVRGGSVFTPADGCLKKKSFCSRSKQENCNADTNGSCNANALNGTVRGRGVFTPAECCLKNNSFCSRSKQENHQTQRERQDGSSSQAKSKTPVPKKAGLPSCNGFAKLDLATLQKLGWTETDSVSTATLTPSSASSTATSSSSSSTTRPASSKTVSTMTISSHGIPDTGKCNLTKVEFRRLTEQVRDVSNIIKNKFRKPSHEKLFRLTPVSTPDPATQALHVELQASSFPFQLRQWRQLTPDDIPEPKVTRCRPISGRPTTAHPTSRSAPAPPTAPMRPRSVPLHGHRTAALTPRPPSAPRPDTPLVNQGNFDTLSPRILSQLLDDVSPRPPSASYGDRVLTRGDKRSRTKDPFKQIFPDDLSTTSGFDSDDDDEDEEDDDDDDDEASDSENGGFEPSLDEVRRKVPYPQNVLHLRPEKLDAIYVPEDKRDMRRFDFDAENVDLPPYEFKCPLPDKLMNVNLRLCAREGTDWRDSLKTLPLNSVSANVSGMMDRLVELEKMQIVTEDWETKRLRQLGRPRPQNAAGSGSTISGGSRATSARIRDRRCCGNCLQAACVGDCPDKRLNATASGRCEKCRQPLCTGACQDSRYEQRMRHSRSSDALELEVGPPPPQPARSPSRGCVSCQRRHTAKLINANNVVLGRPKSSNATFSRGKASLRPRDLRPASAVNMNTSMLKDFERLGIEPQQPSPPTKSPYQRPRSRNGLLPGKSSRSNRKYSLTDVTYTGRKKKSVRTKASSGRQSAQAVS